MLTPEEQAADEARLAHNRAWQKEWRKKRKAAEPPKSPKPKSLKELAALQKAGADLTPEEAERLAAYRERKTASTRHGMNGRKQRSRPSPGRSKSLPPRKSRDSPSRRRKRNALKPAGAGRRTPTKTESPSGNRPRRSRRACKAAGLPLGSHQEIPPEDVRGSRSRKPAAQARYENFLAARRENYHRKKHDEKGEQIA